MRMRYELWVNMTVEADSQEAAFDYAFEAMHLAEGQGLMDHRAEELVDWSIEGLRESEKMWTSCGQCERLNVQIVEGMAPEFCDACD